MAKSATASLQEENRRLRALIVRLAELAEFVLFRQRGAGPALRELLETEEIRTLREENT